MLAAFLSVILNILLIGSMLGFVAFSVWAALSDSNSIERLLRFGMLFSGALVVLGAEAGGVNFSQFIAGSLSNTGGFPVVAGVVVPGAAGIGLGLFLLQAAHNGGIFAIRIIIFVGMLAAAQFAEIYAHALTVQGVALGRTVSPNISFVVGILLCLALTLDPKNPQRGLRILKWLQSGQPGSIPSEEPAPPTGPATVSPSGPSQQPNSWTDEKWWPDN